MASADMRFNPAVQASLAAAKAASTVGETGDETTTIGGTVAHLSSNDPAVRAGNLEQMVRAGVQTGDTADLSLPSGGVKKISYMPKAYQATYDYFLEANEQRKAGNYGKSFVNGVAGFFLTLLSVLWTVTGALPMLGVTAARNGYNSWKASRQVENLTPQVSPRGEPSASRTSSGGPGLNGLDSATPGDGEGDGVSSPGTLTPKAVREDSDTDSVDGDGFVVVGDTADDAEIVLDQQADRCPPPSGANSPRVGLVTPPPTMAVPSDVQGSGTVVSTAAKSEGWFAKFKRERAEKAAAKAAAKEEQAYKELSGDLLQNLKKSDKLGQGPNGSAVDAPAAPKGVDVAKVKAGIKKKVGELVKLHQKAAKANAGSPNYAAHVGTDRTLRGAEELAIQLSHQAESASDVLECIGALNASACEQGGEELYVFGQQATPYHVYPQIQDVLRTQVLDRGLRQTFVERLKSDVESGSYATPESAAAVSANAMKNLRKAVSNGYIAAEDFEAIRLELQDKFTDGCTSAYIENLANKTPQQAQEILVGSLDSAVKNGLLTQVERAAFLAFIQANAAAQTALVQSSVVAALEDPQLDVRELGAALADAEKEGANGVLSADGVDEFVQQVTQQVQAARQVQARRVDAALTIQREFRAYRFRKARAQAQMKQAIAKWKSELALAKKAKRDALEKASAVQIQRVVRGKLARKALAENTKAQNALLKQFTDQLDAIEGKQAALRKLIVDLNELVASQAELDAELGHVAAQTVQIPNITEVAVEQGVVKVKKHGNLKVKASDVMETLTALRQRIVNALPAAQREAAWKALTTGSGVLATASKVYNDYDVVNKRVIANGEKIGAQIAVVAASFTDLNLATQAFREFHTANFAKLEEGTAKEQRRTKVAAQLDRVGTTTADLVQLSETVMKGYNPAANAVEIVDDQEVDLFGSHDEPSKLFDVAGSPVASKAAPARASHTIPKALFGEEEVVDEAAAQSSPLHSPAVSPRVLLHTQLPPLVLTGLASRNASGQPSPLSAQSAFSPRSPADAEPFSARSQDSGSLSARSQLSAPGPKFVFQPLVRSEEELAELTVGSAPVSPAGRKVAGAQRSGTPTQFTWSGKFVLKAQAAADVPVEQQHDQQDAVRSPLASAAPSQKASPRSQVVEEDGDLPLAQFEEEDGDLPLGDLNDDADQVLTAAAVAKLPQDAPVQRDEDAQSGSSVAGFYLGDDE